MRQIQSGGCEACSNFQVLVTQSFPILWDPRDFSPSGSSVHGILQVRILEWVAIPLSSGSSWPRDWTQVSCIVGRFFTIWATIVGHKCLENETCLSSQFYSNEKIHWKKDSFISKNTNDLYFSVILIPSFLFQQFWLPRISRVCSFYIFIPLAEFIFFMTAVL